MNFAVTAVAVACAVIAAYVYRLSRRRGRNPFAHDARVPRKAIECDEDKRRAVLKNGYLPERVPENLDVIVVGSGLGGLVAAALLAKAGKKVCVFEQHDQAGGCLHTFTEAGFEFDTGVHYVGEMLSRSGLRFLMDQLTAGQVAWAPLSAEYDVVALNGSGPGARRVPIAAGRVEFEAGLVAAFPGERAAIRGYIALLAEGRADMLGFVGVKFMPRWLGRVLAASGLAPLLFRFFRKAPVTLDQALRRLTDNAELRAVLGYCFGDYGTMPGDASVTTHATITNHFLQGVAYPVGGSSQLAYALASAVVAAGGAVLVRAPVERIVLQAGGGAATGVVLARDGAVVRAAAVVSAAGVFNTFEELLPLQRGMPLEGAAAAAAAAYTRHLRRGIGGFQVFIGLHGSAEELGLAPQNVWAFADPAADVEGSLRAYLALRDPPAALLAATDVPVLFVSFPSAKDPSWAARHPGRSTCEIVTVAPWQWFADGGGSAGASAAGRPGKRSALYEARKAAVAGRAWAQVQALFPRLAGHAPAHLSAGTPATNAFYLRAGRGEMYGADHDAARFSAAAAVELRPGTGVAGLYLTGQDVFLCGVAGATFGGLLCASELLGRNLYADLMALKARSPPVDFPYGTARSRPAAGAGDAAET